MIKTCPHKFKLRVLDKQQIPKISQDAGSHIHGSVPHAQAEDFFKLPVGERDLNFFDDTFNKYWLKYVNESRVDYAKWGKKSSELTEVPWGYSSWEEYGYFVKQAEARNASRVLAWLIAQKGLHTRVVRPELPFRVMVEPKSVVGLVEVPGLILGGRIDLVFEAPAGMIDIWDIKAVGDPKKLDDDQLMIYKMGVEGGEGKRVRDLGYMLLKQGQYLPCTAGAADLTKLRANMRLVRKYFEVGSWPARPGFYCKFCDVRYFCRQFNRNKVGNNLVDRVLRHGKVPI